MKRSAINQSILHALKMLEREAFKLPEFGYWELAKWRENKEKIDNLAKIMLGWDVTDFGMGDFDHVGSVLFTVRNGSMNDPKAGTPYAEKIIIQRHETEQEIPFHFHKIKTEDIINRGGGILMLELYNSTPDGGLDRGNDIFVKMDGFEYRMSAGAVVEIEKGCSITLHPGLHHRFWAKKGAGDLIVGEVSFINDDNTDNMFLEARCRFSEIEEDESAFMPLCKEYHLL